MNQADLDLILDSIDIDDVPDPIRPEANLSSTPQNDGAAANGADDMDIDLDELLDSVAEELLSRPPTIDQAAGQADLGIKNSIEYASFQAVISKLPSDIKSKWSHFFTEDPLEPTTTRLLPSDHYHGKVVVSGRKKIMQDCIRRALKRSGVSELKISEVIATLVSNPVEFEGLCEQFEVELLDMHKDEILNSPSFSSLRYPHLARYYGVQS